MNRNNIENCFEMLGYDFILDEDFRIWLLEVNQNPGLDTTCPHLNILFPRLIHDTFRLFVYPYTTHKDHLKDDMSFLLDQTDYELIYGEPGSKFS